MTDKINQTTAQTAQKIHQALRNLSIHTEGDDFWAGRCMGLVITALRMWEELRQTHPDIFLRFFMDTEEHTRLFTLKYLTKAQEIVNNNNIQAYLGSLPGASGLKVGQEVAREAMEEQHGFLVMMLWQNPDIRQALSQWLGEQIESAKENSLELNIPLAGGWTPKKINQKKL